MQFLREEARFKNFIMDGLFTTNSFLRDNFFLVNLNTSIFFVRAAQINQTIQVISLSATLVHITSIIVIT